MTSNQLIENVDDHTPTKEELIRMGPAVVRQVLEAQGRYSRKRRREHAYEGSTGKANNIRIFARILGINLGYQVPDPFADSGMRWWHKGRRTLIEEIVQVIGEGTAPKSRRLRGKQTPVPSI